MKLVNAGDAPVAAESTRKKPRGSCFPRRPDPQCRVRTTRAQRLDQLVRIATYKLDVTWDQCDGYDRAVDLAHVTCEHTLAIADALRVCLVADMKQTSSLSGVLLYVQITASGVLLYAIRLRDRGRPEFSRDQPLRRRLVWRLAQKHLENVGSDAFTSSPARAFAGPRIQ